MKKQFELIATVAAGLEAVVGRELRDLGYDCQVENGRVRFQGDSRTIIETNLWLRARLGHMSQPSLARILFYNYI